MCTQYIQQNYTSNKNVNWLVAKVYNIISRQINEINLYNLNNNLK